MRDRWGTLLVVSGPSGAGKSTLTRRLRGEFANVSMSTSATTRKPREGEKHGEHYYFYDRGEFERLREAGHFCEWAEVHGNLYGTPRSSVDAALAAGETLLFDIDVQGAASLRSLFDDAVTVMLLPPTMDELRHRLELRSTEDRATLERRLHNAREEISRVEEFEYLIVNDDLDQAYDQLRSILVAARARTRCVNQVIRERFGVILQQESCGDALD